MSTPTEIDDDIMQYKAVTSTEPRRSYIVKKSIRFSPAQKGLIKATLDHERRVMLGSADTLQLVQNIARAIGAKKTLDVGVYTGYSALSIAEILPKDGKVIALDINEDYASIGKPFWKQAGVEDKIDLRIAPALDTLDKLLSEGEAGTFDFAFIDADKPNYPHYYERCLQLLRPGGVIGVDNTLYAGGVYGPPTDDVNTNAIMKFNNKVMEDDRVHINLVNAGDGLTLAFKK